MMKIKMAIASAALFATTAAFAQMTQPGGPAASTATPPMTTGATTDPTGGTATDTMGTTGTTGTSTTTDTMSSGTTGSGTTTEASASLTQGADGKWMNGDRPATKSEISAHKKAMKASKPR